MLFGLLAHADVEENRYPGLNLSFCVDHWSRIHRDYPGQVVFAFVINFLAAHDFAAVYRTVQGPFILFIEPAICMEGGNVYLVW